MRRIVITGGPCTGKTTIINELKQLGYNVFSEVARKVIKQEVESNSNAVPWEDVTAFSKLVLKEQQKDFESTKTGVAFYDRGIPDLLGYLNHAKLEIFAELKLATQINKYNIVFICPPWQRIYTTDNERKESFEQANLIHNELAKAYENAGYDVVIVPKSSLTNRVQFIIKELAI